MCWVNYGLKQVQIDQDVLGKLWSKTSTDQPTIVYENIQTEYERRYMMAFLRPNAPWLIIILTVNCVNLVY